MLRLLAFPDSIISGKEVIRSKQMLSRRWNISATFNEFHLIWIVEFSQLPTR